MDGDAAWCGCPLLCSSLSPSRNRGGVQTALFATKREFVPWVRLDRFRTSQGHAEKGSQGSETAESGMHDVHNDVDMSAEDRTGQCSHSVFLGAGALNGRQPNTRDGCSRCQYTAGSVGGLLCSPDAGLGHRLGNFGVSVRERDLSRASRGSTKPDMCRCPDSVRVGD